MLEREFGAADPDTRDVLFGGALLVGLLVFAAERVLLGGDFRYDFRLGALYGVLGGLVLFLPWTRIGERARSEWRSDPRIAAAAIGVGATLLAVAGAVLVALGGDPVPPGTIFVAGVATLGGAAIAADAVRSLRRDE